MMKTLITICLALTVSAVFADDCKNNCCGGKSAAMKPFDAKDAEFLTKANEMMMASEGKGGACCKGEAKVMACPTQKVAKKSAKAAKKSTYKVFVSGEYEMFCCPDMAEEARAKYEAKGIRVGKVQKVAAK